MWWLVLIKISNVIWDPSPGLRYNATAAERIWRRTAEKIISSLSRTPEIYARPLGALAWHGDNARMLCLMSFLDSTQFTHWWFWVLCTQYSTEIEIYFVRNTWKIYFTIMFGNFKDNLNLVWYRTIFNCKLQTKFKFYCRIHQIFIFSGQFSFKT